MKFQYLGHTETKLWFARMELYYPDGNWTLQTQDTSVPRHFGMSAEASKRHFGTGAEVSRQFGPKTLRHQDVSALVSGHFGTNAWTLRHYIRTPLRQCDLQGHSRSSLLHKDSGVTQGHRQCHHSIQYIRFPIFHFNTNYTSIL